MKTIIAGSRGILDLATVSAACEMAELVAGITPTVVFSGAAKGVDTLGEEWALARGIPIQRFPAPWGRLPKSAGKLRNVQMGKGADALIAVWDGQSTGTAHMISIMRRHGKPVWVHEVRVATPPGRDVSAALQARRTGDIAADACTSKADAVCPGFSGRAYAFIAEFTEFRAPDATFTGEELTDRMKEAGIVPHDDRAFGSIFSKAIRDGLLHVVGSATRTKGHGTAGARVYAAGT